MTTDATKRAMASIKAAITRFDKAAQDYAFMGCYDPEMRPLIKAEYVLARESIERMIERNMK